MESGGQDCGFLACSNIRLVILFCYKKEASQWRFGPPFTLSSHEAHWKAFPTSNEFGELGGLRIQLKILKILYFYSHALGSFMAFINLTNSLIA
jgi:hypothetical protein